MRGGKAGLPSLQQVLCCNIWVVYSGRDHPGLPAPAPQRQEEPQRARALPVLLGTAQGRGAHEGLSEVPLGESTEMLLFWFWRIKLSPALARQALCVERHPGTGNVQARPGGLCFTVYFTSFCQLPQDTAFLVPSPDEGVTGGCPVLV